MGTMDVFAKSLTLYGQRFGTLVGVAFFAAAPKVAALAMSPWIPSETLRYVSIGSGMVFSAILSIYAMGFVTAVALQPAQADFASAKRFFWPLTRTGVALAILSLPLGLVFVAMAGLVALTRLGYAWAPGAAGVGVIVGISFFLWYGLHVVLPSILGYAITVREAVDGFGALRRSRELVQYDYRNLLANATVRLLGLSLLILTINLALYALSALPFASLRGAEAGALEGAALHQNLIQSVVGILAFPVSLLAYAVFYLDLVARGTRTESNE